MAQAEDQGPADTEDNDEGCVSRGWKWRQETRLFRVRGMNWQR